MSSSSDNLRPTKLINQLIAYIDDVTGATEIREGHAILKQVFFFLFSLIFNDNGVGDSWEVSSQVFFRRKPSTNFSIGRLFIVEMPSQ